MKEIRAIRAYHPDLPKYRDIFVEESGMDKKEFGILCSYDNEEYSKAMKGVNGSVSYLIAWRKFLIAQGYEDAVKRADERFLKERVFATYTPEEYDARWEKHMKIIPEDCPPDAL